MSENFYRLYRIKAGEEGAKGFEIGDESDEKTPVLRIAFDIEKADVEKPNNAKIQIWNLSPKNRKILEKKDCSIELKAGYKDSVNMIFYGDVVSAITRADNADRVTELEAVDGNVSIRDTIIKISRRGKVNTKTLYKRVAKKMGLSYVIAKGLKFKKLKRGFSYSGKAATCLSKLVKYNGHAWTIQNGILLFTKKGGTITPRQYVLNSESGLIGIPEKIVITDGKESINGWSIQYLLNGAIGVNDYVKVESNTVTGQFRVKKIQMSGDNFEGDWICTAEVVQVATQKNSKKKKKKRKKTRASTKKAARKAAGK